MILSRTKPAMGPGSAGTSRESKKKKKIPKVEEFLQNRDFTGAKTLLEFNKNSGKGDEKNGLWSAYCAFHLGDYKAALEEYQELVKSSSATPDIWINIACCYFFLGMYKESDEAALKGPGSRGQVRLLFHLSHKFNDEKRLMNYHQQLQDIIEDQTKIDTEDLIACEEQKLPHSTSSRAVLFCFSHAMKS